MVREGLRLLEIREAQLSAWILSLAITRLFTHCSTSLFSVPNHGKLWTFGPNVKPGCPDGFDYDALNAEVLLTRSSAKDGQLHLESGMSYRYLVLPPAPDAILAPETRKKIREFAMRAWRSSDPVTARARSKRLPARTA